MMMMMMVMTTKTRIMVMMGTMTRVLEVRNNSSRVLSAPAPPLTPLQALHIAAMRGHLKIVQLVSGHHRLTKEEEGIIKGYRCKYD
jgi:hypothetical protein